MAEIAPDTLIDGRYKVLTRLGSGGMADVVCAEDQQLGRKVALKLLHRRFAEDAEFVERFRREASAAAGLQHPNVVGIYDRGEWDGTYYIAMEYLPGRTLKDVIRQDAPLDPVRAIDLTVQILKAARFAHRRGIVHRDLKPHNVIVDDEDRVKVTDFGIARAGASDMTETGSILGTAQYLSPEQAQGHAVDDRSDLYAVGVILFELLTGHVPFDAESAVTIALKHVSEPPPVPSAFDPSVPPELETIALWALEKDPARRPRDADVFIAALEEAREHVLAAEAPGQRTASFAPAALPFPPPPDTYATEPVPAERRRRSRWWAWVLGALALAAIALAVVLLVQPHDKTVPRVVGQDAQSATAALHAAGFETDLVRTSSSSPVDQVLRQDPAGGAKAKKGATVTLTVSGGPADVRVPAVAGLGQRKATARLQNAGLIVRVEHQPSDGELVGHALGSSPPADTTVKPGSTVTLLVSSGPEQVTVPDVTGFPQAGAKQTLTGQGFVVTVVQQESDSADPGTVLRQTPAGDAQADPGATVTIVVAKAPQQVAVPDVTGQTSAEAVDALSAAGLEPRETTQPVTDPAQDGVVLSQRPLAGTKVAKGAPVRIFVGQLVSATTPDGGGAGQ
ncbi:MAG TPA: Stk1 family PASTA domain-containing Ser/Thr kinase [Conexibacter sp.]|nr:Stk1 family PASTA domain-containing Ser/Thr kinase [Conexibacter sp.]